MLYFKLYEPVNTALIKRKLSGWESSIRATGHRRNGEKRQATFRSKRVNDFNRLPSEGCLPIFSRDMVQILPDKTDQTVTVGVKELISVYSFRSVILSACCSHSVCFQKYEVGSWRKRTDLVAVARHTRRCWRWVWRVQGRVRCSRSLVQSRRLSAATERQGPPWRSNHALEGEEYKDWRDVAVHRHSPDVCRQQQSARVLRGVPTTPWKQRPVVAAINLGVVVRHHHQKWFTVPRWSTIAVKQEPNTHTKPEKYRWHSIVVRLIGSVTVCGRVNNLGITSHLGQLSCSSIRGR